MRWLIACGVAFCLAGCGGDAAGSHEDDGSGGGTNDPTVDASSDPGDANPSGDANGSGGTNDGSIPPQAQPIGQDGVGVSIMRTDATHLYWARTGWITTIRRMPLEGGAIETLYTGPGYTQGLAVDGGFVYVAQTRGAQFNWADLIVRFPAAGGAPTTLVTPIGVRTLDVEGGWVYYGDTPDFPPRVMKVAVTGGTPHFIVRARASAVPYDLRADGGFLFYTDDQGITRVEVQTKKRVELVDGLIATQITVDDSFVYFIGCTSGTCAGAAAYRVPRAGGAFESLGTADFSTSRIDVIDNSLQWGTHVLATTGGVQRTLLVTQNPHAVVATAQAFYFGDSVTGAIYRAAR
jgi:phage pi2 protein 07